MSSPPEEITRLLEAHRAGDREALGRLVPLVYGDLRQLARRLLAGRRSGHTLQTTGLVHEAYLKLADAERVAWKDRGHFFAVASLAMRQIIVDHARHHRAQKRGGSQPIGSLEDVDVDCRVSAASIWEAAIKVGLGKLPLLQPLPVYVGLTVGSMAAELLSVTPQHALGVEAIGAALEQRERAVREPAHVVDRR